MMTRTRIVLGLTIVVFVTAVLGWALARHTKPLSETLKAGATSSPPKQPAVLGTRNAPEESPAPAQALSASPPPAGTPPTVSGAEQGFVAGFYTPIRFYGRAVDQHGAPVVGAEVELSANDKPFGGKISEYTRHTDADGRFSIEGIVGLTLYVVVSKPGYRRIPRTDSRIVTSSGLFPYGYEMNNDPNRKDKNDPVVFTLYKVGPVEPLVRIEDKSFRVARDGSPTAISLDQQGGHQVVLRCWNTDLQRPPGQRKYDWWLEVSVPGGGLVVREDAFAFEAPESGYLTADMIERPASLPRWSSTAERSYFLRFGDGTFARASLRMQAGGNHFVMWTSFFNAKTGSRNLEADPAKATP